jgi:hypothetical protein
MKHPKEITAYLCSKVLKIAEKEKNPVLFRQKNCAKNCLECPPVKVYIRRAK